MDEMVDIAQKTSQIKSIAARLGFADVGITPADPIDASFFLNWLSLGYAATMHYLERNTEKRADIREILPGAKSVIVVAENYFTPYFHGPAANGKISRYAWGDDYHDVVLDKLRSFCIEIESLMPGSVTKPYVDTGPTMDKLWAARAGIGWQGKHSNIISRKFGSWFFIGLIITTAEFLTDSPIPDFCGNCTACISACPTDAIVSPYVVDGSKCLSYWTIEAKPDVEIPVLIAQNMEGWIFGCDICQEVCPWNRFQKESDEPRYLPRNEETSISPAAVDSMLQDEFSARFRKSPVKRTKLAGLKRNASVLNNNQSS